MKYYKVTVKASIEKEISVPADSIQKAIERADFIMFHSDQVVNPENVKAATFETEEEQETLDTILALELGIQLGYDKAKAKAGDYCCECEFFDFNFGECTKKNASEAPTEPEYEMGK